MPAMTTMTHYESQALKDRVGSVLSEILSDKYDCNVTLEFVPKERNVNDERSKTA